MPTVDDMTRYLDAFAPPSLAAEWDNTGLLLGDAGAPVAKLMTCLTITAEVVAEAVAEGVGLIVSHHPVLFKAVKKLTTRTADGKLLLPLLHANIAVYSPHTSFDNCPGGINDGLATRLGLINVKPLRPREHSKIVKLVVFTPESDLARVSDAMFAAGAGHIGNYSECSFRTAGTGTFRGDDSTNPTVGVKNRREDAPEWRLEVIVPEAMLSAVVAAMTAAHSYEVPAYDIFPLKNVTVGGEGRIGDLPNPMLLEDIAQRVKAKTNSITLQVVKARTASTRVAVACGAAGDYLADAIRAGADAFVVGELRYHDAITARAAGVNVFVTGHHASERPGVEDLAERLAVQFPGVPCWASKSEYDPLANV
jgi:dinuclear metal center YbgI/SA1388 family protein